MTTPPRPGREALLAASTTSRKDNRMAQQRSAKARFWDLVRKADDGECWIWIGSTNRCGYGIFHPRKGITVLAHRYAHEKCLGPIPKGKMVLHSCDVRACVNPRHLRLGTQLDNMRDKIARGRQPCGERHHNSRLTADEVRFIRLSEATGASLARRFDISPSTISSIRSRKAWESV
jgi:hypothetical protein